MDQRKFNLYVSVTKYVPSLLQGSPSRKIVCHCIKCKNASYGASTEIVFLKAGGICSISTLDGETIIYRIRIDGYKASLHAPGWN
jgi:hypothetical protein